MTIPFYGRLILALILVMILAQVAPEPINYALVLVLIGLLLSKSQVFGNFLTVVSSVGKKG